MFIYLGVFISFFFLLLIAIVIVISSLVCPYFLRLLFWCTCTCACACASFIFIFIYFNFSFSNCIYILRTVSTIHGCIYDTCMYDHRIVYITPLCYAMLLLLSFSSLVSCSSVCKWTLEFLIWSRGQKGRSVCPLFLRIPSVNFRARIRRPTIYIYIEERSNNLLNLLFW